MQFLDGQVLSWKYMAWKAFQMQMQKNMKGSLMPLVVR